MTTIEILSKYDNVTLEASNLVCSYVNTCDPFKKKCAVRINYNAFNTEAEKEGFTGREKMLILKWYCNIYCTQDGKSVKYANLKNYLQEVGAI